jgi:dTDP-4-dehydrorhamnose 3,5-epimerase
MKKAFERIEGPVNVQDYSPKVWIEGVEVIDLIYAQFWEGYFTELARIDGEGGAKNVFGFSFAGGQISLALIKPGSIKAWHVHPEQTDVWFVPPDEELCVGLWDRRKNSQTKGETLKLVLGAGQALLLRIPPGVAHGCVNHSSRPVHLTYFTDHQFSSDREETEEGRKPWDALGAAFWEMGRG